MKRLNAAIILTVIALLCVGCAFPVIRAYPEPQLAETEASFVWVGSYTKIHDIDGNSNSRKFNPVTWSGARKGKIIEVPPGSHRFTVGWSFRSEYSTGSARHVKSIYSKRKKTVTFTGKPGHIYFMKTNVDVEKRIWNPQVVECKEDEWCRKKRLKAILRSIGK